MWMLEYFYYKQTKIKASLTLCFQPESGFGKFNPVLQAAIAKAVLYQHCPWIKIQQLPWQLRMTIVNTIQNKLEKKPKQQNQHFLLENLVFALTPMPIKICVHK